MPSLSLPLLHPAPSLLTFTGEVLDGHILDGYLLEEERLLAPGVPAYDPPLPQPLAQPGQVAVAVEGVGQEVSERKEGLSLSGQHPHPPPPWEWDLGSRSASLGPSSPGRPALGSDKGGRRSGEGSADSLLRSRCSLCKGLVPDLHTQTRPRSPDTPSLPPWARAAGCLQSLGRIILHLAPSHCCPLSWHKSLCVGLASFLAQTAPPLKGNEECCLSQSSPPVVWCLHRTHRQCLPPSLDSQLSQVGVSPFCLPDVSRIQYGTSTASLRVPMECSEWIGGGIGEGSCQAVSVAQRTATGLSNS